MSGNLVLINDLCLFRPRTGVAGYVGQLLEHAAQAETGIQLLRLSQTPAGGPLRLLFQAYAAQRQSEEPLRGTVARWPLWRKASREALRVAKQFGHALVDRYLASIGRLASWPLYHEPDGLPLGISAPTVTTIHDLSVLLYPHWHPRHRVRTYERKFRAGLARTRLFLTDAEFTKTELVRHVGIARERIHVVPLAPRPVFRPLPPDETATALARLGLPEHYLLFLGTIEPRKNVVGLLHAYATLPDSLRRQYPLMLAGGWGWRSSRVQQMLSQPPWRDSVRWLGYLSDADLVAVTNGAGAVVYPSFYEGFGLPPLEAMACDTPVITTHAGSLAEVIGDAALIVEPHDESQLARAIEQMLRDPQTAEEYRQRGRARLDRFSWSHTVRQTVEAYRLAA